LLDERNVVARRNVVFISRNIADDFTRFYTNRIGGFLSDSVVCVGCGRWCRTRCQKTAEQKQKDVFHRFPFLWEGDLGVQTPHEPLLQCWHRRQSLHTVQEAEPTHLPPAKAGRVKAENIANSTIRILYFVDFIIILHGNLW
jgi:hypothetical protein